MNLLVAALFVIAGVIHLLPLPGVIGARTLERLYGVPLTDPSLGLLLRHRAVLFGLVGAACLTAAARVELRPLALLVGLLSAGSFLLLALLTPGYNAAVRRVVVADVVAMAALLGAGVVMVAMA